MSIDDHMNFSVIITGTFYDSLCFRAPCTSTAFMCSNMDSIFNQRLLSSSNPPDGQKSAVDLTIQNTERISNHWTRELLFREREGT